MTTCVVCDDLGCEFCPATYPRRNRVYTIHVGAEVSHCVYKGVSDLEGRHEWIPLDGAHPLYLFPDEVLSIGEGS